MFTQEEKDYAVQALVEIVTIDTVSATGASGGGYDACAQFLLKELELAGIPAHILEGSVPNKPVVVGSIIGTEPSLPCVLLNSHYDVVPALTDFWTVPAFAGFRENGIIYGRGTQDMKCVCVQYILSLKKLLSTGFVPKRSIHLSFVPDEEIGGVDGMNVIMASAWWKSIGEQLAT